MAYDEDLSQNRFFVGLQEECPQLYETASSNRFMVSKEENAALYVNLFSWVVRRERDIEVKKTFQLIYRRFSVINC